MAIRLGIGGNQSAPIWAKEQDPSGALLENETTNFTHHVRIPMFGVGLNGEVLQIAEIRNNDDDDAVFAIGLRISNDGGITYGDVIEIQTFTLGATNKQNPGGPGFGADGTCYVPYVLYDDYNGSQSAANGVQAWVLASDGDDYAGTWTATEITDYVVKVDNTGPPTIPESMQGTDADWPYMAFNPDGGVTLADGSIVWSIVYRYVGGGTSRLGFIKRSGAGVWSIVGGLDDRDAGNEGANETSLALGPDDSIIANIRKKSNTSRWYARSDDGGATWYGADSENTDVMTDLGIGCLDMHGAIGSNPDDRSEIYLAVGNDTGKRGVMTVFKSTDAGETFSSPTIVYDGASAYPCIKALDGERLVLVFEAVNNEADYGNVWYNVKHCRLLASDIGTTPNPIWHQFNELGAGYAMLSGPSVLCHGGSDVRAFGQTAWTYTANGVQADGTNSLILQPARASSSLESAYANRTGSWTFEVVADFTNIGTSEGIAGTATGAGAAGWALYSNASGKPAFSLYDGVGSATTITGATDLSGVQAIAIQRDTANTALRLFVDGVEDATAVADAQDTTHWAPEAACRLGAFSGGASPVSSGVVFYQERFWRKAVDASDLLTTSTAKTSTNTYLGYAPALPTDPRNNSECKLWVSSVAAGGILGAGIDPFDPIGPYYQPAVKGTGICRMTDYISALPFNYIGPTLFRGAIVDRDTTVGLHYYHHVTPSNSGMSFKRASNSVVDFIHQDANFTIIFTAIKLASTGASQVLFDNTNNFAGAPGVWVAWGTNSKLYCYIRRTGASRIQLAPTWTTATFSVGTWYLIAISGTGASQPLKLRYAAWPGSLAAPTSLTSENTASNVDATDNSDASTQALSFFASSGDVNDAKVRTKDILFFDTADEMTDAEILAYAELAIFSPGAVVSRGTQLGLGLGI